MTKEERQKIEMRIILLKQRLKWDEEELEEMEKKLAEER